MTAMVAGISKAAVEREAAMMEASSNFIWARKLRALRAALDKAEAERDRLRAALAMIDAIDPEHRIDGCAQTVVRGLVLRMGETARAALKGETP